MEEHGERGPKVAPPQVEPFDGVNGRVRASDLDGAPTRSRGASVRWLSFLGGLFVVLDPPGRVAPESDKLTVLVTYQRMGDAVGLGGVGERPATLVAVPLFVDLRVVSG